MKKLSILWILIALVLSGCGNSNRSNTNIDLSGAWVSQCKIIVGRIGIETLTFSAQELFSSGVYFDDYNCTTESGVTSQRVTTYSIGNSVTSSSGNIAHEIDIDVFVDDELLYSRRDIVSVINSQLFFGIPISFEDCDPKDIVEIFPTVRGICNQRPTELDFELPYYEQI